MKGMAPPREADTARGNRRAYEEGDTAKAKLHQPLCGGAASPMKSMMKRSTAMVAPAEKACSLRPILRPHFSLTIGVYAGFVDRRLVHILVLLSFERRLRPGPALLFSHVDARTPRRKIEKSEAAESR
ncbi:hypothetical protein [Caballeronia sp. GAWG2-1]|uniref:hypothetical protein n=1 Tax=Caballeronia sp. GAWG2-1 TaxID=2921744 RepID=UPI002027EB76|nr:hypothetical protein [Caballeronia sp. GAWG2-1]